MDLSTVEARISPSMILIILEVQFASHPVQLQPAAVLSASQAHTRNLTNPSLGIALTFWRRLGHPADVDTVDLFHDKKSDDPGRLIGEEVVDSEARSRRPCCSAWL